MALIFSWFPIMVSANKISPHHMSYWQFFQRHGFQTSPAGMKTNIHKPSGGVQRNKGQGILELQSEAHDLSSPPIFCAYRKLSRNSEVPNQLFQLGHHIVRNRDPLKLRQEKGCIGPGNRKLLRTRRAPGPGCTPRPTPEAVGLLSTAAPFYQSASSISIWFSCFLFLSIVDTQC